MLSPLPLLFLLLLSLLTAHLSSASPTPTQPQEVFLGCPSMKIRCVKESNWPSGIVGDIGVKEFVWRAPRCQQADAEANTKECNETFEECEERCEAYAPIPF